MDSKCPLQAGGCRMVGGGGINALGGGGSEAEKASPLRQHQAEEVQAACSGSKIARKPRRSAPELGARQGNGETPPNPPTGRKPPGRGRGLRPTAVPCAPFLCPKAPPAARSIPSDTAHPAPAGCGASPPTRSFPSICIIISSILS